MTNRMLAAIASDAMQTELVAECQLADPARWEATAAAFAFTLAEIRALPTLNREQ